jgi:hypothetical protein
MFDMIGFLTVTPLAMIKYCKFRALLNVSCGFSRVIRLKSTRSWNMEVVLSML